jgi:hypothetical protein
MISTPIPASFVLLQEDLITWSISLRFQWKWHSSIRFVCCFSEPSSIHIIHLSLPIDFSLPCLFVVKQEQGKSIFSVQLTVAGKFPIAVSSMVLAIQFCFVSNISFLNLLLFHYASFAIKKEGRHLFLLSVHFRLLCRRWSWVLVRSIVIFCVGCCQGIYNKDACRYVINVQNCRKGLKFSLGCFCILI